MEKHNTQPPSDWFGESTASQKLIATGGITKEPADVYPAALWYTHPSTMHFLLLDHFASWASLGAAALTVLLLGLGVIPKSIVALGERAFRSIANRQSLLLILIPAASLAVNAIIAIHNGIPRARVQDEFSYLLAADTFSHGRLTNPTPPFWEHFETPHELMRPSYMSKYPPGQGMALALGKIATGMPIAGIWLITAALCGVIYWMLLGFASRPWALLGGIMSVVHPLLIHWSQIYWGGSVAALGGAIVLGTWSRLMRKPSASNTFFLALGLVILANSRPFEGLLFAAPLMLALIWQRRKNPSLLIWLTMILLPAAAAMGYYNHRITGHVSQSPYQEYIQQYDVYPKFWFMNKLPARVYHDELMQSFHTIDERWDYDQLRSFKGFPAISIQRFWLFIISYAVPWILMLPLMAGLFTVRDKIIRWVWITGAVVVVGLWQGKVFLPHYAAPFTAAFFLLIMIGLRQLSHWRPIGRIIYLSVIGGFLIAAVMSAYSPISADSLRTGQLELIEQSEPLRAGKHLIFVRYGPGHLMHDEWVYNAADLDSSRIIWARQMGKESDAPVAKYFSDRSIWLLTVGKDDLYLNPYPLEH